MQLGGTHKPIVFIDVETTGLSPRAGARIIEIGALRVEQGKITKKLNTLIYPECDVPFFITRITGIADEHVTSAPIFSEVVDKLEGIMKDAVFVAHNVNFDYSFFQSEFERIGKSFAMPRFCTVQLSKTLFPQYRSHKLEHVINRHNYQVKARHRAYDDAEVLYRFFTDMIRTNPSQTHAAVQKLLITT